MFHVNIKDPYFPDTEEEARKLAKEPGLSHLLQPALRFIAKVCSIQFPPSASRKRLVQLIREKVKPS